MCVSVSKRYTRVLLMLILRGGCWRLLTGDFKGEGSLYWYSVRFDFNFLLVLAKMCGLVWCVEFCITINDILERACVCVFWGVLFFSILRATER